MSQSVSPCCNAPLKASKELLAYDWCDGVAMPPLEVIFKCSKCDKELFLTLIEKEKKKDDESGPNSTSEGES